MFVPAEGALIAGRYVLDRVIGRGGMGEVWRAHDRELGAPCAVKFLLPHLAIDKETRVRFLREARAAAVLRSPHAVQVLGAGEHEGTLYLAMELLEGESLAARLKRVGRLDAKTTFAIVEQVTRALSRAQQANIVHRDLKPENIWLWDAPDTFVKVLDFGVAKAQLELGSVRTMTGMLLGTPQYMSPEQANGDPHLDHRSDLWALAIITFECLTGKRPYDSAGLGNLLVQIVAAPPPRLADIAPELPAGLEGWWKRALARAPAERFQSAEEWLEGLRPALFGSALVPAPDAPARALSSNARPRGAQAGPGINADGHGSIDPLMTTHGSTPSGRRRHQGAVAVASGALMLALVAAILVWRGRPISGTDTARTDPTSAVTGGPPENTASTVLSSARNEAPGTGNQETLSSPARSLADAGAPAVVRIKGGTKGRAKAPVGAGPSSNAAGRPARSSVRATPAPRAAGSSAAGGRTNEAADINERLGF